MAGSSARGWRHHTVAQFAGAGFLLAAGRGETLGRYTSPEWDDPENRMGTVE